MKGMNTKNTGILSGLLGLGCLIGLGMLAKETYQERRRQKVLSELRDFFTKKGPIAVLYVDAAASSSETTTGGVVMTDGQAYTYTYHKGHINTEEDTTC